MKGLFVELHNVKHNSFREPRYTGWLTLGTKTFLIGYQDDDNSWSIMPELSICVPTSGWSTTEIIYRLSYLDEDEVLVRVGRSTYSFQVKKHQVIQLPEDWDKGKLVGGKERKVWPKEGLSIHSSEH